MPKSWKLDKPPKAAAKAEASPFEADLFAAEISHEVPSLDLHGMRPSEAESQVESFLNHAFIEGTKSVRIVHGKGTGILRQTLHTYLKGHPLVAQFRDSNVQLGGATVVALHSKDVK